MDSKFDRGNIAASIILLSYDSKDDLVECIPTIKNQSFKDNEIILVDNSPAGKDSESIIRAHPDIIYIKTGSNLGYTGGNNLGANIANGKYIIVVNPDTLADKDWLEHLIKPLENNPDIALTNSKVLLYGQKEKINTFSNQAHFTGLAFCKGLGADSSRYVKPEEASCISGCSFAIRRDAFNNIGGFDDDFFLYMEDIDLSLRARLAGYKILAVPSSIIYHKYDLSVAPWKEQYLERNRYQIILKNYSIKMLFLTFPALIATETITWGYAIYKGLPFIINKLIAYRWTIANFGSIMKKRRQVQKNRRISDKEFIKLLVWRIPFEQLIENRMLYTALETTYNSFFKIYYHVLRIIINITDTNKTYL